MVIKIWSCARKKRLTFLLRLFAFALSGFAITAHAMGACELLMLTRTIWEDPKPITTKALNPNGWVSRADHEAYGMRRPTQAEQKLIDTHVEIFVKMITAAGLKMPPNLLFEVATSGDSHYNEEENKIILVQDRNGQIDIGTLYHELGHPLFRASTNLPIVMMNRESSWQAGYEELIADVSRALASNNLSDTGYGRSFNEDWPLATWNEHEEHGLFGPTRSYLGKTILKDVVSFSDARKGAILRQLIMVTDAEESSVERTMSTDSIRDKAFNPTQLNESLIQRIQSRQFP